MLKLNAIIAAAAIAFVPGAHAEVDFEGFFRIEKNKKHIGYAINRYESDEATKRHVITLFIKTTEEGKTTTMVTRSILEVAGPKKFTPLCSINYTVDPDVKEILFTKYGVTKLEKDSPNKKFTVVDSLFDRPLNYRALDEKEAKSGKTLDPCDRKRFFATPSNTDKIAEADTGEALPVFPSSFLFYLLELPKLEAGKDRSYEAFSEDDGRYKYGQVKVVAQKTVDSHQVFQIDDAFAGEPIENFVLPSGDPIGARSTFSNFTTYLTSKTNAVGEYEFDQKELTPWFKGVPEGLKNPIAQGEFKTNVLKLIEGFEPPKGARDPNSSEDVPKADLKVPAKRGK